LFYLNERLAFVEERTMNLEVAKLLEEAKRREPLAGGSHGENPQ
jgi:hypothetical protein